jgi:hypothetical protein
MNTILLEPNDVLFFRDGRPMTGSLAGHGAAWPLPNVVNAALHAALHRAALPQAHVHRRALSGRVLSEDRERDGYKFGALTSAGPFPVRSNDGQPPQWFFPRPADARREGSVAVTLRPVASLPDWETPWMASSLPAPLQFAVGSTAAPAKDDHPEPWLSRAALQAYIDETQKDFGADHFAADGNLLDREQQIGIAIDPVTQAAGQGEAEGQIYSAHYLRLRHGWRLGVLAASPDSSAGHDLIRDVLQADKHIVIGGQQRVCTAVILPGSLDSDRAPLALPAGRREGFAQANGKWLVKWALLTPAVWPEISDRNPDGSAIRDRALRPIQRHPGGWLPNWVDARSGQVLLKTRIDARREGRKRVAREETPIAASLVAAIVPKPLVVTGWSLGDARFGAAAKPGAKSTHLAVPAGAVYYFAAGSASAAVALADLLNWHGSTNGSEIKNRRSTLMGEKGFGLGLCGTWEPLKDLPARPAPDNT